MSTTIQTVSCTACETTFPIDPEKVPEGGVRARCSVCGGIFLVEDPRAVIESGPPAPPVATADRVGPAAFPEAGPDPDHAPEPWSGLHEEDDDEGFAVEVESEAEPEPEAEPEDRDEDGEVFRMDDLPAGEPIESAAEAEPAADLDDFTFAEPEAVEPEVETPASEAIEEAVEEAAAPDPEPTAVPTPEPEAKPLPTGFQFGKRDPHEKARRLARVLVSDIITYNPERYLQALENDTLASEFEEEIDKSWAEYVEQVGREVAGSTSYWTDALNDLLARGRQVF